MTEPVLNIDDAELIDFTSKDGTPETAHMRATGRISPVSDYFDGEDDDAR